MNQDKIHRVLKWIADHFFFLIRVVVTLGLGKNKETKDPSSDEQEVDL